jgi:hypothetical protein
LPPLLEEPPDVALSGLPPAPASFVPGSVEPMPELLQPFNVLTVSDKSVNNVDVRMIPNSQRQGARADKA